MDGRPAYMLDNRESVLLPGGGFLVKGQFAGGADFDLPGDAFPEQGTGLGDDSPPAPGEVLTIAECALILVGATAYNYGVGDASLRLPPCPPKALLDRLKVRDLPLEAETALHQVYVGGFALGKIIGETPADGVR